MLKRSIWKHSTMHGKSMQIRKTAEEMLPERRLLIELLGRPLNRFMRRMKNQVRGRKKHPLEVDFEMKSILLLSIFALFGLALFPAIDNPHYMMTDPAIREMMISMDMPRYTGGVPANVAGNWQLMLSDGKNIGLALQQSGAIIFGKGNIVSGSFSLPVTASGSVSDNNLRLDVVPENGSELYAISVNFSRLPFVGTYAVFRADSAPKPGTLPMPIGLSIGLTG
jgi:hypothetical protein